MIVDAPIWFIYTVNTVIIAFFMWISFGDPEKLVFKSIFKWPYIWLISLGSEWEYKTHYKKKKKWIQYFRHFIPKRFRPEKEKDVFLSQIEASKKSIKKKLDKKR